MTQKLEAQISLRDLMRLRKLSRAVNKSPSQLVAEAIAKNYAFYARTSKGAK